VSPSFAANGDVRLAYELAGAGPPLLLVMGLGYDRHGWGAVAGLLEQGFRTVRLDNRGVGASDVPRGPYTVAQLAEDAVAVLDAAEVGRAHVLGVSLGGMIAQELAIAHPARVDRLVLACTAPGGVEAYPFPAAGVQAFARFPSLPLEEGTLLLIKTALAPATVESRPELVAELHRYRLSHPPPLDGWLAQLAAGSSFAAGDRLEAIEAPTLVLTGDADNIVDHRNSELLAGRIRDARLERFPDGGHLFFWEQPEAFAAAVRDFLLGGR
jgi:pimeloyl-ACP methyl ester carboxylesterase